MWDLKEIFLNDKWLSHLKMLCQELHEAPIWLLFISWNHSHLFLPLIWLECECQFASWKRRFTEIISSIMIWRQYLIGMTFPCRKLGEIEVIYSFIYFLQGQTLSTRLTWNSQYCSGCPQICCNPSTSTSVVLGLSKQTTRGSNKSLLMFNLLIRKMRNTNHYSIWVLRLPWAE